MRPLGSVLVAVAVATAFPSTPRHHGASTARAPRVAPTDPVVVPNDNRVPAGRYVGDTLALNLTATTAAWHLIGDSHPAFTAAAFAEEGRSPTIPGPLLRVRVGTPIHVTIRNSFEDTLIVHGLTDRAPTVDSLVLLPHATRDVVFSRGKAGTYQYWATLAESQRQVPPVARLHGMLRPRFDSQLVGAFVVDPAGAVPADRIFVITMLVDQAPPVKLARAGNPYREFTALNGRSWPYTERLHYSLGDTIHWRIVNGSVQSHPMHLHGFYFRVDSHTDGGKNTGETYPPERQRMVVTEAIRFGDAITLTWSPDRVGNWIFHCHLASHVAPIPRIDDPGDLASPDMHDHGDPNQHAMTGMNGLVLGITVSTGGGASQAGSVWHPARRLHLYVQSDSTAVDSVRRWGYVLQRGAEPRRDSIESPGPLLLLTRGEPTSIRVTNRTPQATSVHWHGIELESFYDGVAGWSGGDRATEPAIRPESTFEVHITPKRAGTFMYHTHFNDMTQQFGGLVGPLVVLEPGQRWNAAREILVVISDEGHGAPVIDGSASPPARELHVGTTYRIRVADVAIFQANMLARVARQASDLAYRDSSLVTWRAVAKDGFTLPAIQATVRPSSERVASGETADFELTPEAPGDLRLEIGTVGLTGSFRLYAMMPLHVVGTSMR